MVFPQFTELRALAATWAEDAARHRAYDARSTVASLLDAVSAQLTATLNGLESDNALVTVTEYAQLHGVTTQTVRNWIREGRLAVVAGVGRNRLLRRNATPGA